MEIKRKDAGQLIDAIAQYVAEEIHGTGQPPSKWAVELQSILNSVGIGIPARCSGEAHSNPHIDNCGVCMPNWGWVSKPTKVK